MSVAGGRGRQQLAIAAALFLFLLPLLPLAPAQSARDPWWGPSDRMDPTEGWAVRVPIVVENKLDHTVSDPFVAAELDFSALLVEAGWTNQTVGTETRLRGFTLDVDSIRLVEYSRGFVTGPIAGPQTLPTPHVFYPALLESAMFREFHPERNPAGTVLFQIAGDLRPLEKRFYYVYANPLEYTKTPPAKFDLLERSPLDAFMWGTRGNVYLGFEHVQEGQGHGAFILATSPGETRVTISTYDLGRFNPIASSSTYKNPFSLQQGQSQFFPLPVGLPFKIEATKPVSVTNRGVGVAEAKGYVPGRSGSFADDLFDVYRGGAGFVQLVKSSPGAVTVTSSSGATRTLTNADPIQNLNLPMGWSTVSGNGKFLVGLVTGGEDATPIAFHPHQVPAISGGPSGIDFFSFLSREKGYFRLCPESNVTLRVIDYDSGGNLQIYPEGTLPQVPAKRLAKADMCTEVPVPRTITTRNKFEFYSTSEARDPVPGSPVPFRLFVGAGERRIDDDNNFTRPMLSHYGGLAGVDYYVQGDTGLFGHYNHTRITIVEERLKDGVLSTVNRTRSLQRDEYFALQTAFPDSTGRFHLIGTKPFAASSLAPAQFETLDPTTKAPIQNPIGYVKHIPGRPQTPDTTVGPAEFRGPLVELRSPETTSRQLFRSTGPGSPLSFRLDAVNLGRWTGGDGLSDTVVVTCTTPSGWTVEGCNKEVGLGSGSSERLNVVVTPSVDDVNATRTILVEARSKAGGVAATFKLIVYVEVRYGVGMWFDVEGGRKTIDPPIGLEPGETYRYNIVLKNTGSTQDTFLLAVEDPREGWEQALLLNDAPVSSVRLDGGASVVLAYRVKAPDLEQAPQNIVTITAQSQTSALAGDIVNTATRIRPKVDLDLTLDPQTQLAEPNETVVFNLSVRNKGNDVFTVIFDQDSILPKGWNASLSVDEITLNPNPGNDPALNFVMQIRVRAAESARAGDLASIKIGAEVDTGGAGGRVDGDEVSAVVVVRRVYNLTTPPVFDAEAAPGESLRFVLPVQNRGNGQVALELLPGAVEAKLASGAVSTASWNVILEADGVTIGLNETVDLPLRIDVPAGTPPGLYDLSFTTRLSREAVQNLTIPLQVRELARVAFVGPQEMGLTPGRPTLVSYRAENTGNVDDVFSFETRPPPGWNATVSPSRARLAPGDSVSVVVSINATRDAPDAEYALVLAAQAEGREASPTQVAIDVRRPELSLSGISSNGALRAGELVLVTASVANRGGIEAQNVSVALVVDERVVDKVTLSRIPVGSSAVATMSWVATQRGGDVRVVLDPDEEISLTQRGEATTASVEFGSRLGVPAPGILTILAGLAAVAVALRRKPEEGDGR